LVCLPTDEWLASVADIEDRLGRQLSDVESTRVEALGADASAAMRLYTGRPFGTFTVTKPLRPRDGVMRLPANVTAVSAVATITGTPLSFDWGGLNRISLALNLNRFDLDWAPITAVYVTYTATSATIPPAVKAVACQMVGRAFGRPADQSGLQQHSMTGHRHSGGQRCSLGASSIPRASRMRPARSSASWSSVSPLVRMKNGSLGVAAMPGTVGPCGGLRRASSKSGARTPRPDGDEHPAGRPVRR
jgi:hypothetical protein